MLKSPPALFPSVMAIASQTHDALTIDGLNTLISRMDDADSIEEWSFILGDYVQFGNKKLDKTIAIFNMGAANDCPNLGTDHCQVSDTDCYAAKSENRFQYVEEYRQRQEYVWDSLDPDTFARAFLHIVDRKRNPVTALRFNVSGDFRTDGDIVRVNEVAKRLAPHGIPVYTYSASDYLNWDLATHFTVNASNPDVDADQRFAVVESAEEVPAGGFVCPGECGPCKACMYPGGGDVYEVLR